MIRNCTQLVKNNIKLSKTVNTELAKINKIKVELAEERIRANQEIMVERLVK